ncbi:MAG: 1,4-alpha-glucan branching protein GlgB [Spirochaetales bacterium]|nr:1,4-alpha-glucan branching protein GlgB [Spirochaetales bacterium]
MLDLYQFDHGWEAYAYRYLGAHKTDKGFVFRTFAPKAYKVCLITSFTAWQEVEMTRVHDRFFEVEIPGLGKGELYKYRIYGQDGSVVDHADPYAFFSELRPGSASITYHDEYTFNDKKWMKERSCNFDRPLNIYECHLGSWKKKGPAIEDWYSYKELEEELIPYVVDNGYTHLEVMPLSEHPFDGSWGYQITGFFSPTSRYGNPEELKHFIDTCHKAGLGIIMDFVPVHFCADSFGLRNYDGSALYEYGNDLGYNEWGSCNFDHGKGEVASFLLSSANYFLEEFHFDGLRFDAIRNMIYYQGIEERGIHESNLEFMKTFNSILKKKFPDIMLIAEDSSPYKGVTRRTEEGGLGFDYKWDLGWMNDTLKFFSSKPSERKSYYHKLTFSMSYYWDDRFLLPLSHDEVVHGKAAIIQKMGGSDYNDKFSQARALYMYMMAHPGKKLNFMGNEIGHFREWHEFRDLDWNLLSFQIHRDFATFIKNLNHFYLDNSALWKWDYSPDGFMWRSCNQESDSCYVFERRNESESYLFLFNFSDRDAEWRMPYCEVESVFDTLVYGSQNQTEIKDGERVFYMPRFSGMCFKFK